VLLGDVMARWARLAAWQHPSMAQLLDAATTTPAPVFGHTDWFMSLGGNIVARRPLLGAQHQVAQSVIAVASSRYFESPSPPGFETPSGSSSLFGIPIPCSAETMRLGLLGQGCRGLQLSTTPEEWEIFVGTALSIKFLPDGQSTENPSHSTLGAVEFNFLAPYDGPAITLGFSEP